jgi:type II secretory pathway pseudopilin PulG
MKKQLGFSIVEVAIAVFVLCLAGFGGWYVWGRANSKGNQQRAQNTQSAAAQESQQTDSVSQSHLAGYLNVPEWGVRFGLSEDTKDAYYFLKPDRPNTIYLSLNSLKHVGSCGADETSIGAYVRFTAGDIEEISEEKYVDLFPNAPKVGNYSFVFIGAQAACSDDEAAQARVQRAYAAFRTSVDTVARP